MDHGRKDGVIRRVGEHTPAAGLAGDKSGVTLVECYFTFDVQ